MCGEFDVIARAGVIFGFNKQDMTMIERTKVQRRAKTRAIRGEPVYDALGTHEPTDASLRTWSERELTFLGSGK